MHLSYRSEIESNRMCIVQPNEVIHSFMTILLAVPRIHIGDFTGPYGYECPALSHGLDGPNSRSPPFRKLIYHSAMSISIVNTKMRFTDPLPSSSGKDFTLRMPARRGCF